MATLSATWLRRETRFSLTPVAPSLDGPRDAYDVVLFPVDDGAELRMQGSVHGWQLDHYYLRRIADLCANSEQIAAADASALGPDGWYWCRVEECDWLDLRLSPVKAGRAKAEGRIHLAVLALDTAALESGAGERFARLDMLPTVEDLRSFGRELLAEMEEARRKRIELGLATENDLPEEESPR